MSLRVYVLFVLHELFSPDCRRDDCQRTFVSLCDLFNEQSQVSTVLRGRDKTISNPNVVTFLERKSFYCVRNGRCMSDLKLKRVLESCVEFDC